MPDKLDEKSLKVKTYPNGQHPNSRKNLKPYPKGVSGNKGSGNGYSLKAELKHALDKEARARLIKSTIEGAILREPTPFKEVWDRLEGRLQDSTPPGSQDNRVFNIIVMDGETKELIKQVAGRTGKLIEESNDLIGTVEE